ncbi:MAG: hypothetical protein Q8R30_04955 [bacterium]|nr:hypothetical protein [bacterium]MDZ4286173.1 hypothetical protein [Candidatus Sungbacteria bacterium]
MDQDILQKFEEQNKRLDAVERAVNKIHSYFFWAALVSIALFVLPLIGLLFAIPRFLDTYSSVGF